MIGKVLGGTRVEEISRGSQNWQVRTPRGIFTLPLTSADFGNVVWGDGENLIVATSGFNTGTVIVYEIARAPNSIEFVLTGDPPVLSLTERARASVPHATPTMVTTVAFSQTINYKQRIARYQRHSVTVWEPSGSDPSSGQYVPRTRDVTPPVFEVIHAETKSYAATIPVVLNLANHIDIGTVREPYFWRFTEIGATRDGVPIGLAAVTLNRPPGAATDVPHYYLSDGNKFPLQVFSRLQPSFPEEVTPFWALVDLRTGAVLESTAEPTVTIAWTLEQEGSRWSSSPDFCTFPFCAPVMYVDFVDEVIGGPSAGVSQGTGFAPVNRRSTLDGVLGQLKLERGTKALSVQGAMNEALRTALTPRGFAD